MRPILRIGLFLCVLGLYGCGAEETKTPTTDAGSATVSDAAAAADVSDSVVTDVEAADFSVEDTGPICPGGADCACKESSDCQSAMCIETPAGKRCARTCVDTCPDSFSCTAVTSPDGDAITICTPRWMRLCDPCTNSKSCPALALGKSACVSHGDAGAFCGTACAEATDCPAGYTCRDVPTVEGADTKLCVPAAEASASEGALGMCTCSPAASAAKLSTTCFAKQNDGATCSGARSCSANGLSACIAKPPTAEVCDGVDNDCDGDTDEGSCDDDNVCTSAVCAGADGCAVKKFDDLPCDADDDACTAGDSCLKGVCVPGAPKNCDDKNPCTKDACLPATGCTQTDDDNVPCDDDNPCTLGDTCASGACEAGAAKECKSGQDCIAAVCSLVTGKCGFSNAPTGKGCDDDDLCTKADSCDGGLCLGKKVTCDDADVCTDDACTASSGCVFKSTTAACEDGNLCTLKDSCKAGKCSSGALKNCDDNQSCTADSCDSKTGQCVHDGGPLNKKGCDADGSQCTENDACKAGKCVAGKTKSCDDGNVCTTDGCDAKKGCTAVSAGAILCNADNTTCTVDDRCQEGVCKPGKAKDCDDGNPCTKAVCAPSTGKCNQGYVKDDTSCSKDGATCKSGKCLGGCTPKVKKSCHQNNVVWVDSCGKTGPIATACKANEFCSSLSCVAGKFNANYLVTANPSTQSLGALGSLKFPPTLYTFVDQGNGKASAQAKLADKTRSFGGKLSGKTFDGSGNYKETGGPLTIYHNIEMLWTFSNTTPPTGKPFPDRFTGLIYDTLEVSILGKKTMTWKVTGIRQ